MNPLFFFLEYYENCDVRLSRVGGILGILYVVYIRCLLLLGRSTVSIIYLLLCPLWSQSTRYVVMIKNTLCFRKS